MLTAESILGALAEHREQIRNLGIRRIGIFGFFLEDLFRRRVDLVDRDTVKPALAPYILRSIRYAPGV